MYDSIRQQIDAVVDRIYLLTGQITAVCSALDSLCVVIDSLNEDEGLIQENLDASDPPANFHKQIADKAIADIVSRRNEIIEAFVAKYGADADNIVQIEKYMSDGSVYFSIEFKDDES